MKLLMVLESDFPPDTRVENEISALSQAGHQIHIACYSHKKKFILPDNLPYTIHKTYISPLIYKSSVGALKSGMYFNFWRRFLSKLFREQAFDAIHIHDLPLARVGHGVARQHGIPFILDLHENWPILLSLSTHTKTLAGRLLSSEKQWKAYEKKSILQADQVVVVVEEAKERITGLGADPSRVHVVSNTINLEHFDFPPQERNQNYTTLVYGGGINYHRGLQTVIQSLPYLAGKIPDIRVWIIGPGSYTGNLQSLAQNLGVEKYIEFFGWMPRPELLQKISQAHIALIPHIKSGHTDSTIPHKLFQYMYAGIPILTSNCSPLERIVNETHTGISFRSEDPKSFSESLLKLLGDKSFLKQMPENGKKWVENKYNWNRDAERLVNLYAGLSG